MLNIRIGSVKEGDEGEYIGRAYGNHPASPLANPFPLTSRQDREAVIEKYRTWLWGRINAKDRAVHGELGRLLALASRPDGVTLVCWCRGVRAAKPDCHGDVIKAAMEWIAQDATVAVALEIGAVILSLGK